MNDVNKVRARWIQPHIYRTEVLKFGTDLPSWCSWNPCEWRRQSPRPWGQASQRWACLGKAVPLDPDLKEIEVVITLHFLSIQQNLISFDDLPVALCVTAHYNKKHFEHFFYDKGRAVHFTLCFRAKIVKKHFTTENCVHFHMSAGSLRFNPHKRCRTKLSSLRAFLFIYTLLI